MILKEFRMRHGLYNLRKEFAKWVRKNIGAEWVDEALEKYDTIGRGLPIGGFEETAVFIEMIEQAKKDM